MTAVLERVAEDATLVEESTVECEECSERFPEGDLSEIKSSGQVCDDCIAAYYTTCDDCDDITPDGDITSVDGGYRKVCDDCLDSNYSACARCDEHVPSDDMRSVYAGDEYVCESCCDNHYHYCDYCDYYVSDNDDDHHHGDNSSDCCESPHDAQTFVMPDGTAQDEIIEVTLPDGDITGDGMYEIRNVIFREVPNDDYVLRDRLITAVYNVGSQYVTKDGKFSKRIAKYLHRHWSTKASDDVLSKIGQAAQKASVGGTKRVAFTRQLNLSAEDFYHEGSCWWSEYSYSRCTLKSNGGLGMRTFSEEGYVTGRAWVFPLRRREDGKLLPTFDTSGADAFVVFNGYGDLSEAAQGRALAATVEGWVSRKVGFDPGNMYVNAGGFLVGPADIVEGAGDYPVSFSLNLHSDLWASENIESKVAA